MLIFLASCATQPSIHGLCQNTTKIGTLEFKANGELISKDNMSATVLGYYQIKDDSITFRLTASDIFRDSIQAETEAVIKAKIIRLNTDNLQLRIAEEAEIESYKRIR